MDLPHSLLPRGMPSCTNDITWGMDKLMFGWIRGVGREQNLRAWDDNMTKRFEQKKDAVPVVGVFPAAGLLDLSF